jgi:hypothetical protein
MSVACQDVEGRANSRAVGLIRGVAIPCVPLFDRNLYNTGIYNVQVAQARTSYNSNYRVPSLDRHQCSRAFRYAEKTLKTMRSGTRFLLSADPASLELLRSYGSEDRPDIIHGRSRVCGIFEARASRSSNTNTLRLLSDKCLMSVHRQSIFAYGKLSKLGFVYAWTSETMSSPCRRKPGSSKVHSSLIA